MATLAEYENAIFQSDLGRYVDQNELVDILEEYKLLSGESWHGKPSDECTCPKCINNQTK